MPSTRNQLQQPRRSNGVPRPIGSILRGNKNHEYHREHSRTVRSRPLSTEIALQNAGYRDSSQKIFRSFQQEAVNDKDTKRNSWCICDASLESLSDADVETLTRCSNREASHIEPSHLHSQKILTSPSVPLPAMASFISSASIFPTTRHAASPGSVLHAMKNLSHQTLHCCGWKDPMMWRFQSRSRRITRGGSRRGGERD
jgi:hypothetical protein